MRVDHRFGILLAGLSACAVGCAPQTFPNTLPPRLGEVEAVRDNDDLSAQEKRDELSRLGLDPLTINAVLEGERTGNQFGGTLRTAYEKVTGGRLHELTPDEVQIYSDAAAEEDDQVDDFELEDEQAGAVVALLVENGIETADGLSVFLNDPTSGVPSEIPEDFLQTVFLDFDPAVLEPVLP